MKQRLQELFQLTEKDFGTHESDLYVKWTPQVWDYLKTCYKFFSNCKTFKNQIDGETWIDIPFANDQFWTKRGIK